ncbi:MAG: MarR family winged helix-turn-helix transcriptional regulator [Pseudomonadota bacterium]
MRREPVKLHALLHSADLVEKRVGTLLSSLGIRPRQARVLNVLHRLGAASQIDLADAMDVTAGSMSTMTDRLENLDLIVRHKNPKDRRGDLVGLTPKGTAMLDEVRSVWRDVEDMIATAIGQEKADQLHALTHELKTALGGSVPGKGRPRKDLAELLEDLRPHAVEGEPR